MNLSKLYIVIPCYNEEAVLPVTAPMLLSKINQLVALISFAGVIWAMVTALTGNAVSGWASMTCILCFLSGVQLICIGVVGEYVGKTYMESKHRPRYIISKRTWDDKENPET